MDKKRNNSKLRKKQQQIIKDLLILVTKTEANLIESIKNNAEICKLLKKLQSLEYKLENKDRQKDEFLKWLSKNGLQLENISVQEFQDYGMGLEALKDFQMHELLFNIPRKMILTSEEAKISFLQNDPLLSKMPNVILSTYLLLCKVSNGSFWEPYVNFLPVEYSTVLYFTEKEWHDLKDSPCFPNALAILRNVIRQFCYLWHLIFLSKDEDAVKLQTIFTWQQFRWAASAVMTRINKIPVKNPGEEIVCLIPLWDLCNHTNGHITTDYDKEEEQSKCLALKDFKKGDQIFIFYGARTNSEFFLNNGFVYEENENDYFPLKLGLSKSDEFYAIRTELLDKLKISPHGEFALTKHNPFSTELIAFLRIFHMTSGELNTWQTAESLDFLLAKSNNMIQLDAKCWKFLEMRLKLLLANYKTTVEEDEQRLLKNEEISINQKLIIRLKLTEKRILLNCLDCVKSEMNK